MPSRSGSPIAAKGSSDIEHLCPDTGWALAIRHLEAALSILDRIGEGGTHSASDIENALVYAKKELRALRREEAAQEAGAFPPDVGEQN